MTHPKDRAERRRRAKMAHELSERKYHQRIVLKKYKRLKKELRDDSEDEATED